MWIDPIVEEIHKIREAHAKHFNYDLSAIVEDLRKEEQRSGKKFISFLPRIDKPLTFVSKLFFFKK